jgi:glucose/arabinose dehydrogenase
VFGAANVPEGFTQSKLTDGLSRPTAMEFAPDGRLFVTERSGTIRVVETDGTLPPEPFADISSQVDDRGERGLLAIAFDPDFENNCYLYAYYTRKAIPEDNPFYADEGVKGRKGHLDAGPAQLLQLRRSARHG